MLFASSYAARSSAPTASRPKRSRAPRAVSGDVEPDGRVSVDQRQRFQQVVDALRPVLAQRARGEESPSALGGPAGPEEFVIDDVRDDPEAGPRGPLLEGGSQSFA